MKFRVCVAVDDLVREWDAGGQSRAKDGKSELDAGSRLRSNGYNPNRCVFIETDSSTRPRS